MEVQVGKVVHYYQKLNMAVLKLDQCLRLGDRVHFRGHSTDFHDRVTWLGIENQPVARGEAGRDVLMDVMEPVREQDAVMLVVQGEMRLFAG
jgi:putative protease